MPRDPRGLVPDFVSRTGLDRLVLSPNEGDMETATRHAPTRLSQGVTMSDENRRKYAAPVFDELQAEIRQLESALRTVSKAADNQMDRADRAETDVVFWMNEAEKHGCHSFLLESERIRQRENTEGKKK